MSTSTSTTANAHTIADVVRLLEGEIGSQHANWAMGDAMDETYKYPHKEIIGVLEGVKEKIAALGSLSAAAVPNEDSDLDSEAPVLLRTAGDLPAYEGPKRLARVMDTGKIYWLDGGSTLKSALPSFASEGGQKPGRWMGLDALGSKTGAAAFPRVTVTVSVEPYLHLGYPQNRDSGADRIGGWKATCAELPDWYAVPGECTEEEAHVYGTNLALKELAHRAWVRLCSLKSARGAEHP